MHTSPVLLVVLRNPFAGRPLMLPVIDTDTRHSAAPERSALGRGRSSLMHRRAEHVAQGEDQSTR